MVFMHICLLRGTPVFSEGLEGSVYGLDEHGGGDAGQSFCSHAWSFLRVGRAMGRFLRVYEKFTGKLGGLRFQIAMLVDESMTSRVRFCPVSHL